MMRRAQKRLAKQMKNLMTGKKSPIVKALMKKRSKKALE